MSNSQDELEPELVILPRPQISVALTTGGEICIATCGMDGGYDRIEHEQVLIPLENAQEVIDAMQRALDSRKG